MTAVFGMPAGFRNAAPAEFGRGCPDTPKTEKHCESKEEKRRMWRCGRDALR